MYRVACELMSKAKAIEGEAWGRMEMALAGK